MLEIWLAPLLSWLGVGLIPLLLIILIIVILFRG